MKRLALALVLAVAAIETPLPARAEAADEAAFAKLQERVIEIARRVTPSVVHVEAIVKVNDRRNEVTGSGVIVDAEGEGLLGEFTFRGVPRGAFTSEPVPVGASYGTPGSGTDLPAAGPVISDGGTGTLPQVG